MVLEGGKGKVTETEWLLQCLIEECAEVQHAICTALRFGLNDRDPKHALTFADRNRDIIRHELAELNAVARMLTERGVLEEWDGDGLDRWIADKQERVLHYMEYARKRGTIEKKKGRGGKR